MTGEMLILKCKTSFHVSRFTSYFSLLLLTLLIFSFFTPPAFCQDPNAPYDSNAIKVHLEQGNKYFKESKISEAQKEYEEVLTLNNNCPEVWYNLGLLFETQGDKEGAIESYKNYLILSPGAKDTITITSWIFTLEGEKLYESGDYQEALEKFKEAVKLNSLYAYAFFDQGLVYDKLEIYDLATKAYEMAVNVDPNYGNAHFNLAIHYEADGKYKEAIKHYQEYLRIFPNAKDAKGVKAWVEELKKKK